MRDPKIHVKPIITHIPYTHLFPHNQPCKTGGCILSKEAVFCWNGGWLPGGLLTTCRRGGACPSASPVLHHFSSTAKALTLPQPLPNWLTELKLSCRISRRQRVMPKKQTICSMQPAFSHGNFFCILPSQNQNACLPWKCMVHKEIEQFYTGFLNGTK